MYTCGDAAGVSPPRPPRRSAHNNQRSYPMKRLQATLLAAVLLLTASAAGAQSTLTVCASGCAYANLQTAINAAQLGDTLLLRAGETFTGNFSLPDKGAGTAYITIRSDPADPPPPAAGHRLDPSYAPLLPKILSGNSASAL